MRLTLLHKVVGISLVILILMIAVTAHSVYRIALISDELEHISHNRIPAVHKITEVNLMVLEQAVILEQMMLELDEATADPVSLAMGTAHLARLEPAAVEAFDLARSLLIPLPSPDLHPEHNDRLHQAIDRVEAAYVAYAEQAKALLLQYEKSPKDAAVKRPILAAHRDALAAEVGDLREHLEDTAHLSAVWANDHEALLLRLNVALTGIAAVLGLGLAVILARYMLKALRLLVAGTEHVEAGRLDVALPITTRDEVGKLTGAFNHMIEGLRLKERIRETFGKYVDPRIVQHLLDDTDETGHLGDDREMTVMFIDIVNFTGISERLGPQSVVRMINIVFSHMTDVIAAHGGVVDKFMGDAVMAFWGAPFCPEADQGRQACLAAREAVARLKAVNREIAKDIPEAEGLTIDIRVGIASGEAVVGSIGSEHTRSFTVMGDTVNTGSRLEGANKAYGTQILITEETKRLIGDAIPTREIDMIRVKGKTKPVRVYTLAGEDEGPLAAVSATALAAYEAGRWDEAEAAFRQCLKLAPDDQPAKLFLERIATLRADPPSDWDGVWTFTSK